MRSGSDLPPLAEFLRDLVNIGTGPVSSSVFTDWDVYKRELERIYDKCWLFVAYDSEIPQPGDFVTRRMDSSAPDRWRETSRRAYLR